MYVPTVEAPVSLLLDPALTPAAKVVWLAVRAHHQPAQGAKRKPRGRPVAKAAPPPLSLAQVAAATGLTGATVRKATAQLERSGWYARATGDHTVSGQAVTIPAGILSDNRLRPQAKLLYGLLTREAGQFTYKGLSDTAALSAITVRQCVRELAETGWLQAGQAHQLAPVMFSLLDPGQGEVAGADARLYEAEYKGEAIMKEYLSLLIDSDHFEDNARPGFLINPLTGKPVELDRYYPRVVGYEFNGRQHYETTELFPSEPGLRMQQARDLIKEALCARNGIKLVVIHRADLTLEAMQRKVGALLPLRDLRGHEALIAYLERVSAANRT